MNTIKHQCILVGGIIVVGLGVAKLVFKVCVYQLLALFMTVIVKLFTSQW